MEYTQADLDDAVYRFGEVFVVLDGGKEYEIHGTEEYEYRDAMSGGTLVRVEGPQDGEYLKVEFPLDAIEHVYSHREV